MNREGKVAIGCAVGAAWFSFLGSIVAAPLQGAPAAIVVGVCCAFGGFLGAWAMAYAAARMDE